MMARTALVTDSAVNLPRDLCERYGITVVPIQLFLDGRLYRDEVDITCADFYRWFRQNPDAHISTACPPPVEFVKAYQALAAGHDSIISVHLASQLSGTLASAEQAAALLPTVAVDLIDTGSASMGSGFCVLAAARCLEAGGSAAQATAAARAIAATVEFYATLATLRYVARTGRVPAVAAHAGSMLRLHAVIRVTNGHAELERIERTTAKATRHLIDTVERRLDGRPAHVAVMHADAAEEAQSLAGDLSAACHCLELIVTEFTPVMGASTGPGLVGVAFYVDGGPHTGVS